MALRQETTRRSRPDGREVARRIGRRIVPGPVRRAVADGVGRFSVWPPVGFVRFGSLRRATPIAPMWPPRFGRPIDRYYIDRFVEHNAEAISGEVLEVGDLDYTNRFGGPGITGRSILHSPIDAGPGETYATDLADGTGLPSSHFDCVVLPQTLLFIYDVRAAVATLHRILAPGGVLLVTVPGITQIVPEDRDRWGQFWSFTTDSLHRLFDDEFGPENVTIDSHGTVKTAVAFLHGLAVEDLRAKDFATDDPSYPLLLTVRAVKDSHLPAELRSE